MDVVSVPISLGRNLTQEVSGERLQLHDWLARMIHRSGKRTLHPPDGTRYLNFSEIQHDAASIRDLVLRAPQPKGRTVFVIDLLANSYDLLRESLLMHLGATAGELASTSTTVAILLPGRVPGRASIAWEGWTDGHGGGSVLVVAQGGEVETVGTHVALPSDFADEFKRRAAALGSPPAEQFRRKLLRRLGHFDLGERNGVAECSPHYFYADTCVDELAVLVAEQLDRHLIRNNLKRGIVCCAPEDSWMHKVSMLVESRHDIPYITWPPRRTTKAPDKLDGLELAFLFDIVRTGRTAAEVLATASEWTNAKLKLAFAAVGPERNPKDLPAGIPVEIAHRVSLISSRRDQCPQCELNLPWTPRARDDDPFQQVRAYDMWQILRKVDWDQEEYGPKDRPTLYTPNFGQVFARYGSFIAYKFEPLLRELQGSEVVVVCPEEPAIQHLVKQLKVSFEERLVSVEIPRRVLDEVSAKPDSARHLLDPGQIWAKQLSHLSDRETSVVMIDEFNGSGNTARAVQRLIDAAHVNAVRYVPVLDRSPELDLGSIKTEPLYEIPSPR